MPLINPDAQHEGLMPLMSAYSQPMPPSVPALMTPMIPGWEEDAPLSSGKKSRYWVLPLITSEEIRSVSMLSQAWLDRLGYGTEFNVTDPFGTGNRTQSVRREVNNVTRYLLNAEAVYTADAACDWYDCKV